MLSRKIYTGVGSRETPQAVLDMMLTGAVRLARRGWVVRSGGAPGADDAFWKGASSVSLDRTEIYLPWAGFQDFNVKQVARVEPQPEAYEIASQFHPAWKNLKQGARKMHARNVHQIIGRDVTLPEPSLFVLCWTPGGRGGGGTGQAIRLAKHYDVPVFDLGDDLIFTGLSDILGT